MDKKKIIALAGSSGMIGSAVQKSLVEFDTRPIRRKDFEMGDNEFIEKFEMADILINLTGEPILRRWTAKNRQKILESRVNTARKINLIPDGGFKKQRIYISASAIGIYDSIGDHDESSTMMGKGFIAEVVRQWENEAIRFASDHTRVCILRLGLVLSKNGGLIRKLKKFYKAGLGAFVGDGSQHFSFIHIDDITGILRHLMENDGPGGIFNVVAPERNTYKEFAHLFARKLNKKVRLRIPEFFIRILLGEAAALLTESQLVYPAKILQNGYTFRYATLEDALMEIVN